MKHTPKPLLIYSFILVAVLYILFYWWRRDNQFLDSHKEYRDAITSHRPTINNYLTNQTTGVSPKNIHLISIFVGATPTMQIRADSFTFKDGVLSCRALDKDFHIIGSMHSIVIEEIKAGQTPITSYLNRPSQTQEKQNENPTLIK